MTGGGGRAVLELVARFRHASAMVPTGLESRRSPLARARRGVCLAEMSETAAALRAAGLSGLVTLLRAEHDLRAAALADPSPGAAVKAREATAEMFAHLRNCGH